ncbi:hypothetical protein HanRHA438_Chr05g0242541 [Helianthus annuus]|nr:hypothetical protein HanRHA438_Chr05g0242541 [Helianthus annuus]
MSERMALQGIVEVACWFLWKARNDLRFNGKRCNVEEVFSEVRLVSYFWFKCRAKNGSFDWGDWCKFVNMQLVCWLLPSRFRARCFNKVLLSKKKREK